MKKMIQNFIKRTGLAKDSEHGKRLKGFTLVEIIVILVILAILAAAMIPALTGYIDKAKQKTAITEARSVLTAAQTLVSEQYALEEPDENGEIIVGIITPDDSLKANILKLADISSSKASIQSITVEKGKVTAMKYITSTGRTVNFKDGKFTAY